MKKIKRVGAKLYPMKLYLANRIGEGFRFCFKSTIYLLFQAHDLLGAAAMQLIEILSSIDSTILKQSLGIVATGIKLMDIRCKDPKTSEFTNMPTLKLCLVQTYK